MSLYWRFEPVRVDFHLDGGYTRVILERLVRKGMLDGEWYWEISTSSIPPNLRNIGSRFLLSWQDTYNPGNLEDIRAAYADLPIVELLSE
ncbi:MULTISPECIES: hypothetical protein [Chroococcidiopsis]|jgi:hypothetical protein|uniref:Uncharacterized protein n=1 Tax=Chroococcidiopsis thermalis (strain PCC 7203) TaxID=251229 RepID=K9TZB4_CHRTP|nr:MULTISPECIES: hypothetical protein [Chroococcidiopsis]AFY88182.1 hypothetical protein Chro_2709 [Chroococcidiopsis thermalis PCC 7203]PSB42086.1 hypothetical protein C7B80_28585 [Cyanosarcina cf. burmensis CCALA 770]URD53100.1 hypothetical protein M5J74_14115 [Chroococcidiopsis sp. CCNUC1]